MLALCYCHAHYKLCTSDGCIMHLLYCGYYIIFISLQSSDLLYKSVLHCVVLVYGVLCKVSFCILTSELSWFLHCVH